jgi:hypothetical protein
MFFLALAQPDGIGLRSGSLLRLRATVVCRVALSIIVFEAPPPCPLQTEFAVKTKLGVGEEDIFLALAQPDEIGLRSGGLFALARQGLFAEFELSIFVFEAPPPYPLLTEFAVMAKPSVGEEGIFLALAQPDESGFARAGLCACACS